MVDLCKYTNTFSEHLWVKVEILGDNQREEEKGYKNMAWGGNIYYFKLGKIFPKTW